MPTTVPSGTKRQSGTSLRNDALQHESHTGVNTHSLPHDGVEIWKILNVFPPLRDRQLCAMYLITQLSVDLRVLQNVIHGSAQGNRRGVATSKHITEEISHHHVVVDDVGVLLLRLEESV